MAATEMRPHAGWQLLAGIGFVAGAVALGLYAEAPRALPMGVAGRILPRMPPPPANLPALLFQLGVGSVLWYSVAVAFPLAMWSVRRVPLDRLGRARMAALAAVAVALLAATSVAAEYLVLFRGIPQRPTVTTFASVTLPRHVLPWMALAGTVAAFEWRRRTLQATLDRERLRAEVAEQRLIALTSQLHPHFLFNTLQSISTLIHRDADAADEMLAKLGDLLRDVLRHRDRVTVTLDDELRYVRTYLDIARVRFADRLTFDVDAPAGVLDAAVPLFILQPLVENALTHGIGARIRGGHITVCARRLGDRLQIAVTDNGAGLRAQPGPREGIGLSNTRERLRVSFGADQQVSLEPHPEGGAVVRIEMPYRTVAATARSA